MRGASTLRRVGGCLMVAAALAGATAGSASAMALPTCTTELTPVDADGTASCGFGNISTSYAAITVVPSGTVTATVRCFTSSGITYTSSRTVSKTSTWMSYAPGSGCSLILTAVTAGASAIGNAAPGFIILDPGPMP